MSEARRLRELEGGNDKLKRLLAEAMLDIEAFKVTAGSLWIMRRLYPSRLTPRFSGGPCSGLSAATGC